MLKIAKNQENIIMLFFITSICLISIYVVIDRSVIDLVYLGVLGYQFARFLIVRFRR